MPRNDVYRAESFDFFLQLEARVKRVKEWVAEKAVLLELSKDLLRKSDIV